ncbi:MULTISPECIES: TRAP transporter small permease [unclassified Mesorhizobium]|uniref:TRAP transporter small permease n=1 Tax=unclassified Mesorhizobium TaxID=325217 RepID=UPI000F74DF1D|nr:MULTISPECIES: TRAP transporter small permease [unclassified Mesorhizobium]AZO28631.1 TRAP transporter small permease [Mesorhizobium sp. M1B.F.Ca.ET.045.04.1.1]RWA62499.1 MAG: TRAP transporter small permease subunit [Mesorhizobium sp.]RWB15886.1 MAG: TRAP transporter small permease subunit [Mesorhizobium sp.]RWD96447.1 MAG: TRAP transporter small permease subunit [Mesorhizobium sp.]TIS49800.1 MAG: TRAP transporter small permease [Mesorhizobium sp.]
MTPEVHTQVTAEELAHSFEEEAAPVDLSLYAVEDWVTLAAFWGMVVCVFLQFFTRYVLNNSLAWTEEVAINFLVVVVFLGAAMCVRLSRHIHVDVLYHYLPASAGRFLALFVDAVRIGFFVYMCVLMWRYVSIVARERMTTIDLPRNVFFYAVFAAFALMLVRSIQVFVGNLRRGYSVLERPGAFDGIGE